MSFIRKYEAFRKLIDFECTFDEKATINAHEVIGKCARLIGCMDNVEVQPVKHGHWEEENTMPYDNFVVCSECGMNLSYQNYTKEEWQESFKYCPNCGARMDGEQNER